MKLDLATLKRVSPLLDEVLDLERSQREAWFISLESTQADLAPIVRELLAKESLVETNDILQRGLEFTAPAQAAHLSELQSGDSVGPYRLIRELGVGGMGEVWLAERADGVLKRLVALKLPMISLKRSVLVQRFERERDILASLTHPHIARLYDAGFAESGQPYLALEYVEGEPITEYASSHALDARARIELLLQVMNAVQYAHANLVIHRDLKPGNVLVTAQAQAQLLDFGIAKLLENDVAHAHETELTRLGGRALTLVYAAPEQVTGGSISIATDVWALGILLYELLTEQRPFETKNRTTLEHEVLLSDPIRPSQRKAGTISKLPKGLAKELDTIVLKALKKAPTERYATVSAFADDLDRWLNGEAVLAQPDNSWYRTRKFVGRHRVAVAAGALMTIVVVGAAAVSIWQARVARQEAQTSQAVQQFLLDIFQANTSNQSDPQKARNTTARELLDIGAKKIDDALGESPQAKLKILETLGQLYVELGLNAQAADLHRKRIQVARQLHGSNSTEVATALLDLAFAVNTQLNNSEWEPALKEAERILDQHREADSLLRAGMLIRLADYYQEKDVSKATDYVDAALTIYRKYPPSRDFVSALFSAATVRMVIGNYPQSLAVIEEAIAVAQGPVAKTSAEFLPNLYSYQGDVKQELGDLPGADTGLREGWTRSASLNGDDHIDTITNLAEYAHLLASTGKSATEGIQHLTRTVDALKRANGGDEPANQWIVLTRYGVDIANYGRLEDGLDALVRLHQLLADGGGSWRLGSVLVYEAEILVKLGRYPEAERLLDDAHKMLPTSGIARSKFERVIQLAQLRLMLAQQHHVEASTLAAKLSFENIDIGVQISNGMTDRYLMAQLALALGNAGRAQELAQQSLSIIEASSSRAYLAVAEQRFRLISGKALRSQNQIALAEPMLRQALSLGANIFDPQRSPELADTQIALAQALLDQNMQQEARTLAANARAIHATHKELGDQYRQPLVNLTTRLKASSMH